MQPLTLLEVSVPIIKFASPLCVLWWRTSLSILSFIYDDEKQLSGKGGEQCFHCRMKLGTLLDLKCLALSDKKIKREQSSHLMLQLKLWSAHSVTSVENVRGIRRQLYIWWNKNPLKRGFICHEWNKEEVHDTQIYMNDAHKVMVTSSHL